MALPQIFTWRYHFPWRYQIHYLVVVTTEATHVNLDLLLT